MPLIHHTPGPDANWGPAVLSAFERRLQLGHGGAVISAAFSPDETLLATGSYDRTVILWDLADGSMRHRLTGHQGWGVECLCFSPDGSTLATAGTEDLRLWNVETGACRAVLPGWFSFLVQAAHPERLVAFGEDELWEVDWQTGRFTRICVVDLSEDQVVVARAISSDSSTAALGLYNDHLLPHTVRIFNAATGDTEATWDAPQQLDWNEPEPNSGGLSCRKRVPVDVEHLALSPDGRHLVLAGAETVWRCQSRTGRFQKVLFCEGDNVEALALSPTGWTVAAGTRAGKVFLWNSRTGRRRAHLDAHDLWVATLAFSQDGRRLASGGHDRRVKVWRVGTGACLRELAALPYAVTAVSYSPNGQFLASAHGDLDVSAASMRTVCLWDAATGGPRALVCARSRWSDELLFSADGRQLMTGLGQDATAWEVTTDGLVEEPAPSQRQRSRWGDDKTLACSPDGSVVACSRGWKGKGEIELRSGETGALLVDSDPDPVVSLRFSPDGRTLAAGYDGFFARLWNVATGELLRVFRTHGDTITALAFSPDGKRLAVASCYFESARVWDLETGEECLALVGHQDSLRGVAFSPDGARLATASADGRVKVWDAATGELLETLLLLPEAGSGELREWIRHTPAGEYDCSPGAARFIAEPQG